MNPNQPSVPISFPIETLEDLESRSYFHSFHFPFNKSSVSLQPSNIRLPDRQRILVCHDLAGGYGDDKWIQGGSNADAYTISHWYLMDVFVYFSHHLVTLPPPCWTNTAHKHGVKVLGTFITEWDAGKAIASTMLSTKESAQMYAERLTELSVALGFDGWLLNMEVELEVEKIPNLIEFVSHLTQTMHESVPGSLVIWYDSITTGGKLEWQDQLNDSNKPFFDVCDGIFVNYTWKEDYPKLSATVAGSRKYDVYMGIDVFGRGTYGGGQWNTNVALDVIKKDEVSAAIFAPGWVYETKQPPDFQTAQNRWWSLIEKSWGILQSYPKILPFYSDFDQGCGNHFSSDGKQVSDTPWNNISSQSFQPMLEYSEDPTGDSVRVSVDFNKASYSGGGNISFEGKLEDNASFTARLFRTELPLGNSPLHFRYSVNSDGRCLVGLSLEFLSSTNVKTSILLSSWGNPLITMTKFSKRFDKIIMPHQVTKTEPSWVVQESSIEMNGHVLTEIHAVCYNSTLSEANKPELESKPLDQDIIPSSYFYAVLGNITIGTTTSGNKYFPPSIAWVVEGQDIKWNTDPQGSNTLSVKIIWTLKDGNASSVFTNYNIYVEKKAAENKTVVNPGQVFLGVAKVEAFYVSELVVPSGISSIKFIIQVCGLDGTTQRLDDSPFFQLAVQGNNEQTKFKMVSTISAHNSAWSWMLSGSNNCVWDMEGNKGATRTAHISPEKRRGLKHRKSVALNLRSNSWTGLYHCIIFLFLCFSFSLACGWKPF